MTTIRVPYGRSSRSVDVPDDVAVDVIELPRIDAASAPVAEVRRALDRPLGGFSWTAHRRAGSVAIAVNDKTRPVPHHHLLPPLLDELARHGIADDAITFYIAVGGHPPMDPAEFADVLPSDVVRRHRVVSHDAEREADLALLGETSRGTPVRVNRGFVEAGTKIVVGTIEPHQFVGFSGGVKSAAIGLAGLDTINRNHSLMAHPEARIGTYARNPARQDVEEIGRMVGVDLALNVILDPERAIVRALAGEPVAVMEAGTPLARQLCQAAVGQTYPLVVASPGGHPKDINVYQAQKAIASAAGIVSPGGTIVLLAACPDGSGSRHYEEWVADRDSHDDVLETFRREGFRIGPHKAFQIARDAVRARLLVCTDMPGELARRLLLDPVTDLRSAIGDLVSELSPGERVAVLPHASTTIPRLDRGLGADTAAQR